MKEAILDRPTWVIVDTTDGELMRGGKGDPLFSSKNSAISSASRMDWWLDQRRMKFIEDFTDKAQEVDKLTKAINAIHSPNPHSHVQPTSVWQLQRDRRALIENTIRSHNTEFKKYCKANQFKDNTRYIVRKVVCLNLTDP